MQSNDHCSELPVSPGTGYVGQQWAFSLCEYQPLVRAVMDEQWVLINISYQWTFAPW